MLTPGEWNYKADIGEVWTDDDFRVAIVEDSDANGFAMGATKELLKACRLTLSYAGQLPKEVVATLRDAVRKAERTS